MRAAHFLIWVVILGCYRLILEPYPGPLYLLRRSHLLGMPGFRHLWLALFHTRQRVHNRLNQRFFNRLLQARNQVEGELWISPQYLHQAELILAEAKRRYPWTEGALAMPWPNADIASGRRRGPVAFPDVTMPAYGLPGANGQKELGAVGDGVANDFPAFQNAVTVNEASGGGPIIVPPGIYRLASSLTGIVNTVFWVYNATFTGPGAASVSPRSIVNPTGTAFSGPNPWYDVLAWGAKGDGATDDSTAIQNAINACANTGGTVWFPPTSGLTFAVGVRIQGFSNVGLKGAPGVQWKWTGGTATQMLWTNPGAGSNVQRFHLEELIFNTNNTSTVTALFLQSWQYSRITSVKCVTNFDATGVRIETNVGTTFVNNCYFNTVRDLRVSTAAVALQMSGLSTCGPTDQWFFGFICDDIYQGGLREVQYCDSNLFFGTRISATGTPNANWYGVILNDSATPGADVGVYDEQFYGIFIDNGNGPATAAAFVLNWQRQLHVYGLWTGVGAGSPGTLIKDNFSQSHAIEHLQNQVGIPNSSIVYTKNYGYGPLSLGFDQPNYIQGVGSGNGGAPYLATFGITDANVDLNFLLKGSGKVRIQPAGGISTTAAGALHLADDGIATSIVLGASGAPIQFGGRLVSTLSGTPATSNLGANVTSATPTGNDTRGKIVIVMAGALAANTRICTVTFAVSYGATAPVVLLVNQTAGVGLGIADFYKSAFSTGVSFDIAADQALAAGTYEIEYVVIG